MSFLIWYYKKGVKFYLKIWKNLIWFSFYFFSIKRLTYTIFYPWRRSVLLKDWEGFHPLKTSLHHVTSIYFRFFGGVVRLAVILVGLIAGLVVILIGVPFFIVWVLMPLAVIFLFLFIFSKLLFFVILLFMILTILWLAIAGYKKSNQESYLQSNFAEIKDEKIIKRILDRCEISKDEFGKINLDSNYQTVLKELLVQHNMNVEEFNQVVKWELTRAHIERERGRFWSKKILHEILPVGRYWNYGYTPILNKVGNDLSVVDKSEYKTVELINYNNELEKINLSFSKNDRTSVLLLGKAGVGKQSIIHYLSKLIRKNTCHPAFQYKRIIEVDLSAIIKGAGGVSANPSIFVDRVFHEAAVAGNVVLVLKNVSQYFDLEAKAYSDIPNLLTKYLEYPTFQIIATASIDEYHRRIENQENIIKNCVSVEVSEPSEENVLFMLFQNFEYLEKDRIFISFQTIREIIKKSSSTGKITSLPGRAINFSQEVINFWQNNPNNPISTQTVNEFLSLKTGMPQGIIGTEEKEKLLNLEEDLHKRVIGQDHAIKKIASAIKKARTNMKDENRPVGCFLFLGSTGVGKTETAKALAESYYGNEGRMIRFDMNEYQNEDSVDRLIGSIKTNTPGTLTSKVKDNPFSLILLDELEKAHQKVLDTFLQILDEGYVVDVFDEKVSFSGNIIIATSNAGSSIIKEMVEREDDPKSIKQKIVGDIIKNNIFKVEFLNRFDDVIFYKSFNKNQLRDVVNLMLSNLKKRIKEEKNIEIEFEDGIEQEVINQGYRKIFGARSIRRFINDRINNLIVDKILNEKISKGETVLIKIDDIN